MKFIRFEKIGLDTSKPVYEHNGKLLTIYTKFTKQGFYEGSFFAELLYDKENDRYYLK